jgi:hypothetical protein
MKYLSLIAIVVFASTAACSAKNDAKNDGGAPPPPPERADPGPISPNSWLINPPNQPAR